MLHLHNPTQLSLMEPLLQLGAVTDPSAPMITGTTVVFTPHILNCSQTLVFLVFHRPDIVQFSSEAFNVTKTNQTLLICVTVQNRCHLHHSTFRLYSEKGLGLLLNVLFFQPLCPGPSSICPGVHFAFRFSFTFQFLFRRVLRLIQLRFL